MSVVTDPLPLLEHNIRQIRTPAVAAEEAVVDEGIAVEEEVVVHVMAVVGDVDAAEEVRRTLASTFKTKPPSLLCRHSLHLVV